jgi:hypothetical protein
MILYYWQGPDINIIVREMLVLVDLCLFAVKARIWLKYGGGYG